MLTLNNFFDKIYCINLEHRTDRWKKSKELFDKYNIKVDRFNAINGKNISNDIRKNILLDGEIGVLLTHLEIIKECKKNNYKSVFIFEDDVDFIEDFDQMFNVICKQIPENFDFLYLGGNNIQGSQRITTNIHKIFHTYAIQSFGIKNTMFDYILENLPDYKKQIDVFYAELHSKTNSYITKPHLTWQRPDYSDIQGGFMDYTFLK